MKKRDLKPLKFCFLPLITVAVFVLIGLFKQRSISAVEGQHPTMTGAIALLVWSIRGVYVAVLMAIYFSMLDVKLGKATNLMILFLLVALNIPLMRYMELLVYLPLAVVILPIVNLFAFLPAVVKRKVDDKIDEDSR
ncbi:hypothetical protein [Clostridium sp. C8-1-8]|uniref:hypothetical protein n=1 Tax=Clostridium sp. C8-1-8 TaxID=2698831 RepID=UPI00136BE9DA|nr:hypothetical protein [Clostridium sp. C8-1-8]